MPLFANYPGNVEHIVGENKGPDWTGQGGYVKAVAADYDPDIDSTRVEFRPILMPIEIEDAMQSGRLGDLDDILVDQ